MSFCFVKKKALPKARAGRQKKSDFYFNSLKSLTLLKGIVKKFKIKPFDTV